MDMLYVWGTIDIMDMLYVWGTVDFMIGEAAGVLLTAQWACWRPLGMLVGMWWACWKPCGRAGGVSWVCCRVRPPSFWQHDPILVHDVCISAKGGQASDAGRCGVRCGSQVLVPAACVCIV